MNKVILTGRLTAAPEIKTTSSGKSVCDFTLAVDRYTQDGEKQADFVNCSVWGKQAENLCKYKDKGDKIGVVGAVRVDKYKDKDGNNRYKVYILASEIEFLDNRKRENQTADDQTAAAAVDEQFDVLPLPDDDLPF